MHVYVTDLSIIFELLSLRLKLFKISQIINHASKKKYLKKNAYLFYELKKLQSLFLLKNNLRHFKH